jgi:hypothetical protein
MYSVVKIMIEKGAFTGYTDQVKNDTLYFAVMGRSLRIVELLLGLGADPNSDISMHLHAAGESVYTFACGSSSIEVVQRLSKCVKSVCGFEQLHNAIFHNKSTNLEFLVKCGANVNEVEDN